MKEQKNDGYGLNNMRAFRGSKIFWFISAVLLIILPILPLSADGNAYARVYYCATLITRKFPNIPTSGNGIVFDSVIYLGDIFLAQGLIPLIEIFFSIFVLVNIFVKIARLSNERFNAKSLFNQSFGIIVAAFFLILLSVAVNAWLGFVSSPFYCSVSPLSFLIYFSLGFIGLLVFRSELLKSRLLEISKKRRRYNVAVLICSFISILIFFAVSSLNDGSKAYLLCKQGDEGLFCMYSLKNVIPSSHTFNTSRANTTFALIVLLLFYYTILKIKRFAVGSERRFSLLKKNSELEIKEESCGIHELIFLVPFAAVVLYALRSLTIEFIVCSAAFALYCIIAFIISPKEKHARIKTIGKPQEEPTETVESSATETIAEVPSNEVSKEREIEDAFELFESRVLSAEKRAQRDANALYERVTCKKIGESFLSYAANYDFGFTALGLSELFSSACCNRLLILYGKNEQIKINAAKLLCGFFNGNFYAGAEGKNCNCLKDLIFENASEAEDNLGFIGGVCYAAKLPEKPCFVSLTNVNFKNASDYFSDLLPVFSGAEHNCKIYVGEELSSDSIKKGYVNISENLHCILVSDETQNIDELDADVLSRAAVINADLLVASKTPQVMDKVDVTTTKNIDDVAEENNDALEASNEIEKPSPTDRAESKVNTRDDVLRDETGNHLGAEYLDEAVINAKDLYYIEEDIWKKFDALESFAKENFGLKLDNKFYNGMEALTAAFIACGEKGASAADVALSVSVIPKLAGAIASNANKRESETPLNKPCSVKNFIDKTFGATNVPFTMNALDAFGIE